MDTTAYFQQNKDASALKLIRTTSRQVLVLMQYVLAKDIGPIVAAIDDVINRPQLKSNLARDVSAQVRAEADWSTANRKA